jgi:hypothetical protein
MNLPDIGLLAISLLATCAICLMLSQAIGQRLSRKACMNRFGYASMSKLEDHINWLNHQIQDDYWNPPELIEKYTKERNKLQKQLDEEQERRRGL